MNSYPFLPTLRKLTWWECKPNLPKEMKLSKRYSIEGCSGNTHQHGPLRRPYKLSRPLLNHFCWVGFRFTWHYMQFPAQERLEHLEKASFPEQKVPSEVVCMNSIDRSVGNRPTQK